MAIVRCAHPTLSNEELVALADANVLAMTHASNARIAAALQNPLPSRGRRLRHPAVADLKVIIEDFTICLFGATHIAAEAWQCFTGSSPDRSDHLRRRPGGGGAVVELEYASADLFRLCSSEWWAVHPAASPLYSMLHNIWLAAFHVGLYYNPDDPNSFQPETLKERTMKEKLGLVLAIARKFAVMRLIRNPYKRPVLRQARGCPGERLGHAGRRWTPARGIRAQSSSRSSTQAGERALRVDNPSTLAKCSPVFQTKGSDFEASQSHR